jgi:predicted enzyme related to lactoylglutathione lyase
MLQFSHIMLYVNDMERAARWYQEVLGFEVQYLAAPHYASLRHEAIKLRLDLHPDPQGQNVGHGSMVYFSAADLDAAVAFLRERRVTVSDPRRRGDSPRFTEFADSEGNPLGLYEAAESTLSRGPSRGTG